MTYDQKLSNEFWNLHFKIVKYSKTTRKLFIQYASQFMNRTYHSLRGLHNLPLNILKKIADKLQLTKKKSKLVTTKLGEQTHVKSHQTNCLLPTEQRDDNYREVTIVEEFRPISCRRINSIEESVSETGMELERQIESQRRTVSNSKTISETIREFRDKAQCLPEQIRQCTREIEQRSREIEQNKIDIEQSNWRISELRRLGEFIDRGYRASEYTSWQSDDCTRDCDRRHLEPSNQ